MARHVNYIFLILANILFLFYRERLALVLEHSAKSSRPSLQLFFVY